MNLLADTLDQYHDNAQIIDKLDQMGREGEFYYGRYYPYTIYPQGHFDCANGSTEYDYLRSSDVERSRMHAFYYDGFCRRGTSTLKVTEGDKIIECLSTGEKRINMNINM